MIAAIPLTVIPLILYNIVGFVWGSAVWQTALFGMTMISGQVWSLTYGDLMILLAIVMLFLEIMKAGRTSSSTITNHILSTIVLIVYVIEFIVVGVAATSVFFILTLIALFDVVAGFSISIRAASRDISLGQPMGGGP